jgi:hypothetical protein
MNLGWRDNKEDGGIENNNNADSDNHGEERGCDKRLYKEIDSKVKD